MLAEYNMGYTRGGPASRASGPLSTIDHIHSIQRLLEVYIRHGYVGDGCIDRESFNDLAVFELEKPVEFSRNVFPVCLPITSDPPRRGETGYRLFGFGRDVADKEMETGILKELDSFVTDCSDEIAYDGIFCTSSKTSGLSCDVGYFVATRWAAAR
uniref:Peptidase S1 domain-containing protein n=1 Tax=Caenorhabditis japonica TaxID=281687 RepID=A0A8R1DFU4_CAEJA